MTGGDAKALGAQLIDKLFGFLHEQGAYASFAIVMSLGFGWLAVWAIKRLIDGKPGEIDRMAAERDKFQAPFLEHWASTHAKEEKKAAKK